MATDTENIYDNMTRLRMKMVQQKIAHERDKVPKSESEASDDGYENELKLQDAILRRQELLDRIREEKLNEGRPRTHTPRKKTPSPVSRRSLTNINDKDYYLDHKRNNPEMAQVKHVIEHQFRPGYPQPGFTQFPPIAAVPPVIQPLTVLSQPVTPAEVLPLQTISPAYTWPALAIKDSSPRKDTMFNKSDFMDMMMLQNAQMHHMCMQQMMLHQLPGGSRPYTIPFAEPAAPVALMRPAPSVYHHHISQPTYTMPPMDYRGGGGNGPMYGRNYNSTIYDDGSNYYQYY